MVEETVVAEVNETPDDAAERSAEGVFYRSQAEIDSAIGKRLSAERSRWEKANEGAIRLAEAVRHEHGADMSDEDILNELNGKALEKRAGALGLAPDSVRYIMKADAEGIARSLIEQERELKQDVPDFDLEGLMANPHAKLMALAGVPLKQLHEFLDMPAKIEREKELARLEVVENMRRRNLRVEPEGGGVDAAAHERLSDHDVRAIDERLKRGERVYI